MTKYSAAALSGDPAAHIVGPGYTPPRNRNGSTARVALAAGLTGGLTVFLHCIAPTLF